MKYLGWVLLVVALSVGYCRDSRLRDVAAKAEQDAKQKDDIASLWKAKYSEASMEADKVDTVWRRQVARVDSVRVPEIITDSLRVPAGFALIDTAQFRAYVASREEALETAARVMLGFRAFRVVADSTIAATTASRDAWKTAYQTVKPKWYQNRIVVSAGYGATVHKVVVVVGPQVTLGVRIWSL